MLSGNNCFVYFLLQILKSDPLVLQKKRGRKEKKNSDLFGFVEPFLAKVGLVSSGVLEEDSRSQ